jgi:hypothetical protein
MRRLVPNVWRPDASGHAPMDLHQGVCRYQVRGDGLDRQRAVRHGGNHATAPVRPHPALRQPRPPEDGNSIDPRGAHTFPLSPDDAHMAMPHQGVRRATHTLP